MCDHRFDIVQSFSDDALTDCPQCAGRLRKLYGSVGVVFKGSGFYRTDSRAKQPADKASSGDSSSPTKTETKSESSSTSSTSSSSSSSSSPGKSGPANTTAKAS